MKVNEITIVILKILPDKIGENTYRIKTNCLKNILLPAGVLFNNLGYLYSESEIGYVLAEFEVNGSLLPYDFRFDSAYLHVNGNEYYLKPPETEIIEHTKGYSKLVSQWDLDTHDTLVHNSVGNLNIVYEYSDMLKQLYIHEDSFVNRFKTAGIPEIPVDVAFNIIDENYIYRNVKSASTVSEAIIEDELTENHEEIPIIEEVYKDNQNVFEDDAGMSVYLTVNPSMLDLFVLDASFLNRGADFKENLFYGSEDILGEEVIGSSFAD